MNIMRLLRLLCGIYIIIARISNLHASEHPSRGLLIFLDNSEKGNVGAVTGELFTALAQKAGPILASTSVLKNLFSEYGKDMKDPSYWNIFRGIVGTTPKAQNTALIRLFEKLGDYQQYKQEDLYQEKKAAYKYILLKATRFNPNEWVVKKVNDFLYLLIPIAYLHKYQININEVIQENAQTTSDTELKLGLHINHMKTSRIEDILQETETQSNPHNVIQSFYDQASQKSSIFCIRSEYYNQPITMPTWAILITGHGRGGSKIVDLPIEDFKKLLDFLENKIVCHLLVYDSCFSAGDNIQAAYNDMMHNLQDTYSFPIIIHALTDAAVFGIVPYIELDTTDDNLKITTKNNLSFTDFLQAVEKPEITDYKNAIKHIFNLGPDIKANDAPQIKMPGLEWFSALDTDQVVGIGQILAQSRNSGLSLNIETFFKKDPRIILLYAPHIPFALQLNPSLKAIVSMIPGNALHTLQKVSSATQPISTIINMFMKINILNTNKLFFIKEVQGIDTIVEDLLIVYSITPGIHGSADTYNCTAYYFDNKKLLVKHSKRDTPRNATSQEIEQYQAYMQRITEKPQYIPHATYHPIVSWELPNITFPGPFPLSQHAIIETIETPDDATLEDIFDAISLMQPDRAITLIGQIRGIPLNDTTSILLTNVIVDKEQKRLLYTFNGRFFDDKQELSEDYMPQYKQLLTPPPLFEMRQGSLLPLSVNAEQLKQIQNALVKRKLQGNKKRKRDEDTA